MPEVSQAVATLPAHRVLERCRLDPNDDPHWFYAVADSDDVDARLALEVANEDRYHAVTDAICAGRQIRCDSNLNDANLKEVCTTKFTDPETGEWRFAVEVWNGLDCGKHDFATDEAAYDRHYYYYNQLGL